LLQHDFRDPNRVGIGRLPPRKRAGMSRIPGEEPVYDGTRRCDRRVAGCGWAKGGRHGRAVRRENEERGIGLWGEARDGRGAVRWRKALVGCMIAQRRRSA
jgi:hypothetical protein